MEEKTGRNMEPSDRQKEVDLQSRKANKKNLIFVIFVFILLLIITGVLFRYIFMGESDHQKGSDFLKDKNYTEAQYKFQNADLYNKNFSNAGSEIKIYYQV